MDVMDVPFRPCVLNKALATSSRLDRIFWPAVRVARTL
jgi:hypothetical protein